MDPIFKLRLGFDAFGAAAALWGASETGFKASDSVARRPDLRVEEMAVNRLGYLNAYDAAGNLLQQPLIQLATVALWYRWQAASTSCMQALRR